VTPLAGGITGEGGVTVERPLSPVEAYLRVGFVPSVSRASAYLDTLLAAQKRREAVSDAPRLLRQILEENTYSKGHREITIPLTGGLDSRAILGAALDIFETRAIRCVTVGVASFWDCVVAAETCRRIGVSHERIDANALRWDLERLLSLARQRFMVTGSFVTLETLVAFGAIGERVGTAQPIISGFLGDAVSGKHLPMEGGRPATTPVEVSFIAANQAVVDGRHSTELRQLFRSFAASNTHRLEGLPGATAYDLLDLGFRQSHYIRANSAAFPHCIRPYEDPRWLRHWLSRPLADRLTQQAYVREMERAFPQVFAAAHRRPPYWFIRPLVPHSLRRWARTKLRPSEVSGAANRGDPRVNESMVAVVKDLLAAFDRRRLLPFRTMPALIATMQRFNDRDFTIVRWASAAEAHIRAGNLMCQVT
jgi:hypothetical protein